MSSKFEQAVERFVFDDLEGEVAAAHRPEPLEAAIRRVIDPQNAVETIHWGRNYLFRTRLETPNGLLEVVVKQHRSGGLKDRLRERRGGGKAARSWRMARAFQAAGVPTPDPLMLVEPREEAGASFFVSRFVPGVIEARYLLRAAQAGREREEFPQIDLGVFLTELGRMLRQMHEAGLFHRDLSIGNVLIEPSTPPRLYLVDLNRARQKPRLSTVERTRDLCRLTLFRREHQEALLRAYWGEVTPWRRAVYHALHYGFRFKIEGKKKLRGFGRSLFGWLAPRSAHPHIPPAPTEASARDKIVWDALSDQPHQHAGRLEKLRVRVSDTGSHLRAMAACAAAAPRIWGAYRELRDELYEQSFRWGGLGVCLRPHPENPEALLEAVEKLGVRSVLLRLHPWQEDDSAEEALARELHGRGFELAFALPQNRELVRDPARWRRRVEELAERFVPYGRHFQVGQAINRSKWGVWSLEEYVELAVVAGEILRRHEGVEVLGPAVIDFELHTTAAVLNLTRQGLFFDAVASLLYVDRRGAPENPQLGFDTAGKVLLLQAIAATARNAAARSWITEVNWPLWEGPHSPAGKGVSVDEATQASYLARFYLLALGTGQVERVYWWQLVARGYGLACPEEGGKLRRRPSFAALATLRRELEGTIFVGPLAAEPGCHLYHFVHPDVSETLVGWCERGRGRARLPRPAAAVVSQGGESEPLPEGLEVELGAAVRYFRLG